jgi:signal transduction histidine kinase
MADHWSTETSSAVEPREHSRGSGPRGLLLLARNYRAQLERDVEDRSREIAAALPKVYCDRIQILHVLRNLIDNAIKAMLPVDDSGNPPQRIHRSRRLKLSAHLPTAPAAENNLEPDMKAELQA